MKNLLLFLSLFTLLSCNQTNKSTVLSPNGLIAVDFEINESNHMQYSVSFHDSVIIHKSKLGFEFENNSYLGENLKIVSVSQNRVDQKWKPVYGERSDVRDNYNELLVELEETVPPLRKIRMTFRAYNEGVAFNYTFHEQEQIETLIVKNELTEFKLGEDFNCWVSDRAQSEYRKVPVSSVSRPAERPLVIEAGNTFVALSEAKLIDFARMKFLNTEANHLLKAKLHGTPEIKLPYTTPWRTIMLAKSPGKLLENNYFYENLNDPCAIENTSWIKPGKVIREVTLTTIGGMACVDFAADNGLQYVEFDAGWYGPEGDSESDATTITIDPKRSPGPLDLLKVIEYAKSKDIGIIVYVNRRALEKQIDEILPLYKKWGISGVKYGFVQVGSQEWTSWLHEAIQKAAENELMVDIHDEYRPTGFSRTYPNLMTQEGIRGDEETPSNEHSLITLFTRMIAGAGDNTNCYFAPRVQESMGGNVSQLAKAVMLYSPWQFLYWYDRPQGSPGKKGGAGSSQGYIQNQPELEFFKNLPTVWDESKVLEGEIGSYGTVARRSGEDWFLGSLTGKQGKQVRIKTDFLNADDKYTAIIYSYDEGLKSSTKVKIEKQVVTSGSELNYNIEASSGLAIHFKKM